MALTPNGETGKTIQLKRTSLAYNNSNVIAEQLNYGEPLYNDNDKTVLIGDNATTTNDNLKVLKLLDRAKANSQVYYTGPGNPTLDGTSGIANLYNENNASVYIKDKNWGNFNISNSAVTYSFTVNSDNSITAGTAMSDSFGSFPCLVKVTMNGMRNTYVPTVSLYLDRTSSQSVTNTKAQQKAFSCISRCDSSNDELYVIFYKKPAVSFNISVVGG